MAKTTISISHKEVIKNGIKTALALKNEYGNKKFNIRGFTFTPADLDCVLVFLTYGGGTPEETHPKGNASALLGICIGWL